MAIKVALAGATGNLGPAILKELLDAGFDVTILSRKESTSVDSLPAHPNQKIARVDYNSTDELKSALTGVEVVVSTLAGVVTGGQNPLIDAAVAAGVKRFLPSEFGSDLNHPANRALPVFQGKIQTQQYLQSLAEKNPNFSYTFIYNNAFFDWGLKVGFVANVKEHKITLYDGGDNPLSFTTLPTIGKAVVGVINNQEATKNRAVYIHDAVFTQKQLIDFIKKIDGKEWTTEEKNTKEIADWAYGELKKPNPDFGKALGAFIPSAALGRDGNSNFSGRTDNKLFGIPENDEQFLTSVVKSLV